MKKFILVVPLLVIFSIAMVIVLMLLKLWMWAVFGLILAIILNCWSETFALHLFNKKSENYDFRVLTFNVNRAHKISVNEGTTDELINFILQQKADLVLLQEYNADLYPKVQEKLGNEYIFSSGTESISRFKSVFSRHPIEMCEQLLVDAKDPRFELFQNAIYCKKRFADKEVLPICKLKVCIGERVIQIFNCHLMSNNYSVVIRNLRKKRRSLLYGIHSIIRRIDFGYKARELQTKIIKEHVEKGFPTIVCGDFNDISGSSSLRILYKAGFSDAWWKGGFGFGFTFHGMGLRLSLDHVIFDSNKLQLNNIYIPHSNVSDHDPLVCDFKIN